MPPLVQLPGGGASTVQAWLAGLWSRFPAASRARTWNVWEPTATVWETGVLQDAKPAPSSEHSKVEPVSVEAKVNVASGSVVGEDGFSPIVVSGGVVSGACSVHEELAGDPSTLPAASRARTWKVCGPGATV